MIEITKDYHSMSSASAEVFMEILEKKSNAVIGLAAGNSQKEMYGILASLPGFDEKISKALFFNIDEYCDISLDRPGTCKYFIENNFISKTKISGKQLLMLNQDSCSGFDGILEKLGGVDLMILGIGINGHMPTMNLEPPSAAAFIRSPLRKPRNSSMVWNLGELKMFRQWLLPAA